MISHSQAFIHAERVEVVDNGIGGIKIRIIGQDDHRMIIAILPWIGYRFDVHEQIIKADPIPDEVAP